MSRSRDFGAWVIAAGLLGGCASSRPQPPAAEYFPVPGRTDLPFSEATRVGDLLFLAGQIGIDEKGHLVPGGIEAETRQTLENLREVLERHGSSLSLVVKCTALLVDMREWEAMNRVYVTYFPRHLPARTAFGVTSLVMGARVELECVARAPGR
jgi:2-iminobutanoate/2-iminopropanoate deaminase